ncbi:peptidoglycan/LPS O-acetylase OafA/YrhL [Arcticibacter tournemirensis]|uniref:Acyltransferase n=1 Tax=Arcticibacter tournemirensis TaxID=699437 RepID=A0A5M9GSG3_9SPHI|nr:acyltransferase [Arcticibacter tournemirensis]KAA8476809.1 acyltransferase [Arcticibacter tournemirensis]TQM50828.1 peptidoglycan/LPS O-acetylase OafA/YrhL [Arcticibacter tournemirensis]
MVKQSEDFGATRPHFKILDGLRGVAALTVVIFHFMEISVPDYNDSFIAHAYLAVDFFFCLSGFVIAYAYDHKFLKMGSWAFLKARLIRLHPLVIIGSVIGLLVFVFDPFSNLYLKYSDDLLVMFLSSCLMIPYPLVHERYFNLFHLNPPTWSLFWEYVANIGYALFLVKVKNKTLWMLTVLAAFLLVYEAHRSGYLGVGWGGDNIIGGGIRVFYSFLAGILVYRSKWIIHSRMNFITVSLLLLAVFLHPFMKDLNWIVEPLIVIFGFPFLVALGAGAQLPASLASLCKWSGDISYPLYMVHYPFVWLFMSYVEKNKPGMNEMTIITIFGVIGLVVFAYLIMVLMDIPLRRWLKGLRVISYEKYHY